MSRGAGADILPDRLPALSDRGSRWLRPLWLLLFAFAVLTDIAGTLYIVRDSYETLPAFAEIGLNREIEDDGSVVLGDPVHAQSRAQGIAPGSRILAIGGAPIAPGAHADDIARAIRAVPGPRVDVRIQAPGGRVRDHALARTAPDPEAAAARDLRLAIRFVFTAIGCLTLLVCATLLYMRRPSDPIAFLLSCVFLAMATSIDPPLLMWQGTGWGEAHDAFSNFWWALLVIALSAFPDGRFEPRWLRWFAWSALPLAPVLSADFIDPYVQTSISILFPLIVLVGQIVRYRRLEPGIERQQIKWAAFGFASGLVLIGVAVGLTIDMPAEGTAARTFLNMVVICLFQLGFALMPLGLMVSLLRFRLWEADRVISRSAAYAIVTVFVGVVWAGSSDLVKELVASMMGEANAAISTTVSAMLAAGIFAPTQSVVLGWTKRHFAKEAEKLRNLTKRLAVWRTTESAPEMGMRALAVIADSVHASSAAILALTPTGRTLVAARDVAEPEALAEPGAAPDEDPRFALALPLEDEDGPVGTLLIGPRSDGNRYNRDEREALEAIAEPLAEAIRFAHLRAEREHGIERKIIDAVEERLAELKPRRRRSRPKPA